MRQTDDSEMFKGDWRHWARKIPTLEMFYSVAAKVARLKTVSVC